MFEQDRSTGLYENYENGEVKYQAAFWVIMQHTHWVRTCWC